MFTRFHLLNVAFVVFALVSITATRAVRAQVPGGCDTPVTQRTGETGCYLAATQALGLLPKDPLFWHLYVYPTRVAAEEAKGPRGTVVESFGKVWLFTIAESKWRASGGEHIATIGPLKTQAGIQYTARYMEAVFPPGMSTPVHRHSAAEAWYLVSGVQCLETPDGIRVVQTGKGGMVPEGPPMVLSSVGQETRRSVLLVLHDTSQPWITDTSEWKPKGRCPK